MRPPVFLLSPTVSGFDHEITGRHDTFPIKNLDVSTEKSGSHSVHDVACSELKRPNYNKLCDYMANR